MKADDPMRGRRREAGGNGEDVTDGGLPKVARAVGRAFGVFRRLSPAERSERARKKVARGKRASRIALADGLPPIDVQRRTEALQQQIRQLESELEPLYHLIAHGTRSRSSAGDAQRELADLVQHARTLKESLQEKRLELTRMQRRMARERLLAASSPGEPPATGEQDRSPRPAGRPGPEGPSPRLRQAVHRVAKKASAKDRSHELILDKTARGMLDEDPSIRRTAALRLGELEDRAAFSVLEAALEDPEEKVRVASMNALAKLGDPAAAGVFERCLADESPHVRLAALRGLAKLESDSATRHLVAALEDDAAAVRKTVATLLGWRGAPGAVTPLVLALRDEEEEVRVAAAASLAALREDRAVLPLIRALADESPEVRAAAQRSLRAIVGEDLDVPRTADPVERIEALKAWWIEARVTKTIAQLGMPLLPDEALEGPVLPAAVPRRAPPRDEQPPARARPAASAGAAASAARGPAKVARAPAQPAAELPQEVVETAATARSAGDLEGLLPKEDAEGLADLPPAAEQLRPDAAAKSEDRDSAEEEYENILGDGEDEDLDSLVAGSFTDESTGS